MSEKPRFSKDSQSAASEEERLLPYEPPQVQSVRLSEEAAEALT